MYDQANEYTGYESSVMKVPGNEVLGQWIFRLWMFRVMDDQVTEV